MKTLYPMDMEEFMLALGESTLLLMYIFHLLCTVLSTRVIFV